MCVKDTEIALLIALLIINCATNIVAKQLV